MKLLGKRVQVRNEKLDKVIYEGVIVDTTESNRAYYNLVILKDDGTLEVAYYKCVQVLPSEPDGAYR